MSKFRNGLSLCDECARLIRSFIFKVKSSGQTGSQFKKEKSRFEREREDFDNDMYESAKLKDPEYYDKYLKEHHDRLKRNEF